MQIFRRHSLTYVHDVIMAALSFVIALYLRVGELAWGYPTEFIVENTAILTVAAAFVFWPIGLYRGVWRYASVNDLVQITKAVTLVILLFVPATFVLTRGVDLPRSLPAINWFVLLALLGGPRFIYRLLRDRRVDLTYEKGKKPGVPILLVGAGDEAETFIRANARSTASGYRVVGVLDEKGKRVGRRIHHTPVLGDLDDLDAVLERLARHNERPQRLVVAKDLINTPHMAKLLEAAERRGMSVARLPRLTDFQAGESAPLEVRPIAVEDLLGRPQTVLDRPAMQRLIAGRRVLVTGAGGTIGSELVRQVSDFAPAHVTLLDNSEFNLYAIDLELGRRHPDLARTTVLADVRDRDRIAAVVAEAGPELAFHAAALKHVPMVEIHACEGVLTNVTGTRNVADACRAAGVATMLLISTDKAVNPTNVMGATKRVAESYCQALDLAGTDTRFQTVRFGNVLGSTGSVVPLFRKQLAEGGPLTVTHPDMTRYFMTVREAVELVLQASALGDANAGRLFVLDMGEPVRILDLARQMIRLSGKTPDKDVEIVFTGPRPGEKLTEELFHDGEALTPTKIADIRLAAPRTADLAVLDRAIAELTEAAAAGDDGRTRVLLQRLVPEMRGQVRPAPPAAAAN